MDAEVDQYIIEHQMSYVFRSPFRTDVPDLLRMIDVFCLPSLWEGLSIGLLESMAMGKAIIVTPTDGTREVITNEHSGLIVPFSSPAKISDNIIRLKADSELRQRCGTNARQLVATRFNAQKVADSVAEVYKSYHKASSTL
jgi:glycosyltransferase involved in cell wall biosynthesis